MQQPQVLNEKTILQFGKNQSVVSAELHMPNSKNTNWEYTTGNDVVVALALTEDSQVYLNKEWRVARKDFVWEVSSGGVEKESATEEELQDQMNLELQQEIGFKADKLEKLACYYPSNPSSVKHHLYLATELTPSKLKPDDLEFVETKLLPFKEAYDLVIRQQIPTAQNFLIFELVKQKLGLEI